MPAFTRFYLKFKQYALARISLKIMIVLALLLATLETTVNDKPVFISYQQQWYFPIFKHYPEKEFGGSSTLNTDYKSSAWQQKMQGQAFIIWPLVPYSYQTLDYDLEAPAPAKPSARHWLGTDNYGRDILAFAVYSLRFSLVFGLTLTILSSIIGIFFGALQGYFGGLLDLLAQRFLEIWSGLPQLFILIILAGIIYPSFSSMLIILLLFSWTSLVSAVRAEFLKARKMDYVRAAKALGVDDFTIMRRHIFPNAMVATLTFMPFILTGAIVSLASLDYLGLGLAIGAPSLGDLLRQGKELAQTAPWIGLTGFVVMSSVLSLLMFISDGVRNALDPRK